MRYSYSTPAEELCHRAEVRVPAKHLEHEHEHEHEQEQKQEQEQEILGIDTGQPSQQTDDQETGDAAEHEANHVLACGPDELQIGSGKQLSLLGQFGSA